MLLGFRLATFGLRDVRDVGVKGLVWLVVGSLYHCRIDCEGCRGIYVQPPLLPIQGL